MFKILFLIDHNQNTVANNYESYCPQITQIKKEKAAILQAEIFFQQIFNAENVLKTAGKALAELVEANAAVQIYLAV